MKKLGSISKWSQLLLVLESSLSRYELCRKQDAPLCPRKKKLQRLRLLPLKLYLIRSADPALGASLPKVFYALTSNLATYY
jgi:hypothetical protein